MVTYIHINIHTLSLFRTFQNNNYNLWDNFRRYNSRQGNSRQDNSRQDNSRKDNSRQDNYRQDNSIPNNCRQF